jgi:methionine-rich copper-binding protein CopC
MNARRSLVGLLAAAFLAGAAVPALAHTELVSTSPAKGAVVKHLPATITMRFTEAPQKVVSGRVLLAGSTTNHATRTRLNPKNAREVLMTTRKDQVGAYTVVVKLIAPDGDSQSVVYRFRVKR